MFLAILTREMVIRKIEGRVVSRRQEIKNSF